MILPFAAMAQPGFTINGKVGALNAPAKAYLIYRTPGGQFADSTNFVNGAFTFKVQVEVPVSANIRIKHAQATAARTPLDVLGFYIENKAISITAKDSVKHAVITGSPVNDDNAKLTAMLKPAVA